ncbi:MAG: prohibitin family protein [Caldilineaceae bacterium]
MTTSNRNFAPGTARQFIRLGVLVITGIVAVMLLTLLRASWRTVRPGYVGVVFDKISHTVTSRVREPGWTLLNPFTQSMQEYPVTIQNYSMVQKGSEGAVTGDDSVKVQSSEGQQVNLDVVIQYQVNRDEAGALYQDWAGQDISVVEDRVVRAYTRSAVPEIAALYGWEEITASKRAEISKRITDNLAEEFALRHLVLVSFGIREVHLPDSLQQALNTKIQAQQQAEQQKYQLEQAKVQAEQARVTAEGQAEAVKAQAEGEAAAIRVRAQAQAEANQAIAKSLTSELIRYQQMQRWDGKLPVFQGASAMPWIDASGLISTTAR